MEFIVTTIASSYETSISPGSSILVYSTSDFGPYIGGDSIGELRKPAEQVGAEASRKIFGKLQSQCTR